MRFPFAFAVLLGVACVIVDIAESLRPRVGVEGRSPTEVLARRAMCESSSSRSSTSLSTFDPKANSLLLFDIVTPETLLFT